MQRWRRARVGNGLKFASPTPDPGGSGCYRSLKFLNNSTSARSLPLPLPRHRRRDVQRWRRADVGNVLKFTSPTPTLGVHGAYNSIIARSLPLPPPSPRPAAAVCAALAARARVGSGLKLRPSTEERYPQHATTQQLAIVSPVSRRSAGTENNFSLLP